MSSGGTYRRDWEAIASLDPYWAVLSDPDRKHHRWEEDEFFATGQQEVSERLAVASELGLPRCHGQVLDFGCGLGRTARALAAHLTVASTLT